MWVFSRPTSIASRDARARSTYASSLARCRSHCVPSTCNRHEGHAAVKLFTCAHSGLHASSRLVAVAWCKYSAHTPLAAAQSRARLPATKLLLAAALCKHVRNCGRAPPSAIVLETVAECEVAQASRPTAKVASACALAGRVGIAHLHAEAGCPARQRRHRPDAVDEALQQQHAELSGARHLGSAAAQGRKQKGRDAAVYCVPCQD